MPVLRRQVLRLLANGRPRIVDEDIETSKPLCGALDSLAARCLVKNIEIDKIGLPAERAQLG